MPTKNSARVCVESACCRRYTEPANDIHQSTLTSRDLTDDDADADQIDNIDLNHRRVFRESLTHFAGGGVAPVSMSSSNRPADSPVQPLITTASCYVDNSTAHANAGRSTSPTEQRCI